MSVVRAYFRHEITYVVNVHAIYGECKRPMDVASVQQEFQQFFSTFHSLFLRSHSLPFCGVWIECKREKIIGVASNTVGPRLNPSNGTTVRWHGILISFTRCEWTWKKVNGVHSTLRMEKSTLPLLHTPRPRPEHFHFGAVLIVRSFIILLLFVECRRREKWTWVKFALWLGRNVSENCGSARSPVPCDCCSANERMNGGEIG